MFSGPCFGDLTPSEVRSIHNNICMLTSYGAYMQDSVASIVDGPTPSPFCLDSQYRSSDAPMPPMTDSATAKEEDYVVNFFLFFAGVYTKP